MDTAGKKTLRKRPRRSETTWCRILTTLLWTLLAIILIFMSGLPYGSFSSVKGPYYGEGAIYALLAVLAWDLWKLLQIRGVGWVLKSLCLAPVICSLGFQTQRVISMREDPTTISPELTVISLVRTEQYFYASHHRYGNWNEICGVTDLHDDVLPHATSPQTAKEGYYYRLNLVAPQRYFLVAIPIVKKGFLLHPLLYSDQTGKIYWIQSDDQFAIPPTRDFDGQAPAENQQARSHWAQLGS